MVKCVICCDNNTDYNTKCQQCYKSVCKHCYSQIVFNQTNHLNHIINNNNCNEKLLVKYCCPFCKLKKNDKIDIDNLCLKCVITSNTLYVIKLENKVKKLKIATLPEINFDDLQFENMVLKDRLEISYETIETIRDVVVNARKCILKEDLIKELDNAYPSF